MKTLSTRLSAALIVIALLMAGAFFGIDRFNTRLYYEELSQNLNAPIAMYVTGRHVLIRDGQPDLDALRELAHDAMIVNPAAEIYLLDRNGRILGHALETPPELDRVELGPLRALIDGTASLPLRGDDPQDANTRKIFSAAEVRSPDALEGYLYVVLGGRTYEALAADIGDSYAGRSTLAGFATIILLAAVVGTLTFSLLTRRLRRLRQEMRQVMDSGFEYRPRVSGSGRDGDEIDELSAVFADMSVKIRDQIGQLREGDRLRRELVSNVSHDLRTPLSAMQGYIETLIIRHDALPADTRLTYLHIVRKHTLRLGRLISDLFELSKLESASVTPNLESFSLPELVHDIAQEFRLDAERKRIELDIDVDAAAGLTVGDIGLIQRVLENLVRNAVKFTPECGRVVISIAERPNSVAVAVSDNGPGIAEEDLPLIFDRFYRARDGEEVRPDSSGIGLAIVKRILDLHGSRITVTSRLDAGTRFEFELPAVRRAA